MRVACLILILLLNSSCAKWVGNLRRDLDDSTPVTDSSESELESPTVGGRWSERTFLGAAPSLGRSPASASEGISVGAVSSRGSSGISSGNTPILEPEKRYQYKHGERASKDDFVDQSQEEGSLWASGGQTNYFFTKNRVRSPGDIITLTIDANLLKDIGTEVRRTLSPKEKNDEIAEVQEQFRSKFLADYRAGKRDALATSASSPTTPTSAAASTPAAKSSSQVAETKKDGTRTPANTTANQSSDFSSSSFDTEDDLEKMVPRANFSNVNIFNSLDLKENETMMGEILERYSNGNYKIRAIKRVNYKKGGPRLVNVVGVVKSTDIAEETDTINAGKLYEYRVEVSH